MTLKSLKARWFRFPTKVFSVLYILINLRVYLTTSFHNRIKDIAKNVQPQLCINANNQMT